MAFKKFISRLLIAACVAAPVCQFADTVHASEIGENNVTQVVKHGTDKQTSQKKKISKQENCVAQDGSKVEDIIYSDNSRKMTIVNGTSTDILEYNPKDNSITLNGVKQTFTRTTKSVDQKTSKNANLGASVSSASDIIWHYIRTDSYSFNFSSKTFTQCCAIVCFGLGIVYSDAESAVKRFVIFTGGSLAAIGASGTLSGTITVEDNLYEDYYNRLRTRNIDRFYYNGSEFYTVDSVKPW